MSPLHSRRAFLRYAGAGSAAAAAGALLMSCSDGDSSTATASASGSGPGRSGVTTQLDWIKNVEFAGMWVADDLGYYGEENLSPTWLAGGPNVTNSVQVVEGGAAQIGISTNFTAFVDAVKAGADVVLIGAIFQESPLAILSLSENPIRSARDMVGKRIGSPQGQQRELDAIFRLNDLEPDYTFVPIGFDVQALVEGDADGMTAFATNQGLILEEQGVAYEAVSWKDLGLDVYSLLLYVDRAHLEGNRDDVVGWMRATVKGWEKNEEDPQFAAGLAVEKYGRDLDLSLTQQVKENQNQIPLTQSALTEEKGLLWVSEEEIQDRMYPILEAADITDLPAIESYVDTSVLEEAFGGKTRLLP